MGLAHNQYPIVSSGLVTHFDPANSSSMISNKKNLLYLNETNSGNFYIANGSVSYDRTESAILWQNLGSFEPWGTYMKNWSVFNTTLNTSKQYTASFEWKQEGHTASSFAWELVNDPGTSYVTSANLLSNSILQSNGWYKFTFTFTPPNSGVNAYYRIITATPSVRPSFRLWWRNLQLEEGNVATSYASGVILNTLYDISGNNLNATIFNPAYDSLNSGSVYLDGTTAYIDTNNRYISKYNSGTISMWVKSRDVSKINHFYHEADTGDGFGGEPEVHITASGAVVTAWIPYGGINNNGLITSIWNSNGFAVSNNVWFNAVLTYSFSSDNTQGTFNFYMNGQANGSGTISNPYRSFTQNAFLGRPRYTIDARSLTGSIGPFMFYDRVLSQSEITQNYDALKGRFGL
jgi:hypothetical protein